MFQVFLVVLKITPSLDCSHSPIKNGLPFHQPTPFIIPPLPASLTSNSPTVRHGRVVETRDDKLHVKFDNVKNLRNLKKTVDLTSNLD